MSQKIKTSVEIDGSLSASQIANATTDTDKFLVSDGGTIKYRTGAELATDLGIAAGVTSKVQHQVKAGVAINKGQAVYVTGADGTNMIVGLASNATEATSSKTMGLLNATVSVNLFADVITEGLLSGLNTSAATVGDPIWLGTDGNLIYGLANKPYAPSHLVFIGIVTRVNANNGEIFVKIQNGFELNEIHDVDLKTTTPINGHLLGFNGTLWVNKTIAGWLGYTPQAQLNGTGFVKASGTTITYDNTSYYPASNPNGYISTYTETDTLASVTGRGASTSALSTFDGGLNIGSTKLRWGGSTTPTLGLPFSGSANAFWIDVNDGDTGGLMVDNEGVTVYGAGDNGYVFRVIDEDVYQATTNVASSTTFQINQGQNGGGSIKGNFDISGTLSASGYNKTNWDTAYGWGNHSGLYLGINSKAADSELLDGIDSTRVIFGDNSTGTISISDATLNGALKSGFYTVGTGGIPNATSVNFVLHTAYNGVGNAAGFDLACNDSTTSSFYLRPATGGGKGSWQTIITSANVGSYAVPSSRTITINGTTQDLSANRSFTVSGTVTSGVSITSAGSANNAPSTPSVNIGMYVDTYAFIDLSTADTNGSWIDFSKANGTDYGGRIRYNNGSDYFSISANANEQVRIFNSNAEALGSFRAPLFYDSNNTGYYVDPASSSNLALLSLYGHDNQLKINTYSGGASGWFAQEAGVNKWETYHYQGRYRWYNYTTNQEEAFLDNSGGYLQVRTSMRAPIFYDSNDTTYYFDGTGGTRQSRYLTISGGGTGNYGNELVVGNTSVQYSLQDTNLRPIIQATGAYPVLTLNHTVTSNGSHGGTVQFTSNGVGNQFVIGSSGNGSRLEIGTSSNANWNPHNGIDNYNGTTGLRMDTSGNIFNLVSTRSPIYYDNNNTGYYVDPTGDSRVNTVYADRLATPYAQSPNDSHPGFGIRPFYSWNIGQANNASAGYSNGISIGSNPGDQAYGFQIVQNMWDDQLYFRRYNGGWQGWRTALDSSNYTGYRDYGGNALYAGIYYDGNNTSYYVDPNGASRMGTINADSLKTYNNVYIDNNYGNTVVGVYSSTRYQGVFAMGDSYKLPTDGTSTGSLYGLAWSHPNAGGVAGNLNTHGLLAMENGTWLASLTGSTRARDDMRAPIFYDNNNTGYYIDPAGNSQVSAMYANNWFRAQGNTGLYGQDYGVHFYPQTGSAWSITGSGGNIELQFRSNHNSTIRGYVYADTSNNIGFLTSGGGWRLRCDDSGNAIATGDVTAYSDRRVKENIHTIDNALDKVNNLRGVYYTRIDSEDKQRKVGVIAQETLEVLPEVVGKDTDGMYNVAYGNITAVLIEAIKEQQTQIEELKQLVNKLINK
jgi:hypothetical protein